MTMLNNKYLFYHINTATTLQIQKLPIDEPNCCLLVFLGFDHHWMDIMFFKGMQDISRAFSQGIMA